MALGSSIYKMVIDTSASRADVVATRREIALQKQIIEATTPVIEKYGAGLDVMQNQLQKGLITLEQHAELHRQLKAELPENVAAEAALNAVFREGESVRRSLMTADQKAAEQSRLYEDAVRGFLQLQREGILVGGKALEAAEKLRANTPGAIQAERERAEALKHSNEVIRDGESALREFLSVDEKFAAAEKRHAAAKRGVVQLQDEGVITDDDAGDRLSRLRAVSPAVIRDERLFADAIREGESARRSLMTTTEQLAESEREWAEAKRAVVRLQDAGNISDDEAGRRLAALRSNSPGVIQAERERGDAIARGKQLTEQWLPVSMRAGKELAEVKAQHLAGRVPIEAYRNAQIQLTASQLTGIPIIGRFAGAIGGVNPVLLPVIAGIAGWTAILKAAGVALDFATDKIVEQYGEMDKLVNASDKLNVPVGQFQAMAHAADRADMTVEEFSKGYETMLSNLSKAASGKPKALEAFNIIEVDAKRLKSEQPEEILRQVTAGLDKVGNASDRLRAATGIFGDTDFLRLNLSDLQRANQILDDTRGRITDLDKANLGELNKATKDLNLAFDSMFKRVAMDLAPALTDAANAVTDLLTSVAKNKTFIDSTKQATDAAHGMVLVAREVPSSMEGMGDAIINTSPKLMLLRKLFSDVTGEFAELGKAKQLADQAAQPIGNEKLGKLTYEQSAALDQLIEKTHDHIATMGMSAGQSQLYALGLDNVTNAADRNKIELAQAAVAEEDRRAAEAKSIDARKSILDSLEEERAKLTLSNQEYEARKVLLAGGGQLEMNLAVGLSLVNEGLQKQAQADKEAAQEKDRHAQATKNLIDRLTEQAETAGMTDRQKAEREIDKTIADPAERAKAKDLLDRADATTKLADASRLAAETIKDLEKQKRQAGMTADEKKLDDLAVAGVNVEQLAIIDTLQKEVALRDKIHEQITATSSVIKAGSREAADAIAQAQQMAFLNQTKRTGAPIISGAPISAISGPVAPQSTPVTTTPRGVPPMIVPPVDKEQVTEIKKTNEILTKIEKKPAATIEEINF